MNNDDPPKDIFHRYVGENRVVRAEDSAEIRLIRQFVAWVNRGWVVETVRISEDE